MKTIIERILPTQQAFIRVVDGETHHVQRDVATKDATIIIYGETEEKEKDVFKRLIERHAKNMSFNQYEIIFTTEDEVKLRVDEEVSKWENC